MRFQLNFKQKLTLQLWQLGAAAVVVLALGLGGGWFWAIHHASEGNRLDFSQLNTVSGLLHQKFDGTIDDGKLLDGAKEGLAAATGDPYTVYLPAKEAKDLQDELNGTLSGIGAEVGIKNQILVVVAPLDGSPAAAAGLRAGDIIGKINGEETGNLSLEEAVSKIRGPKGTQVKLTLVRGNGQPFDVNITRDQITVPSVKWSMKPAGVGYIKISQFGPDTSGLVEKAAADLKGQGATKVIVDLRGDPGGLLDSAVQIGSQFLPQGQLIVEERHDNKSQQKLYSTGSGALANMPTVVLIDGGSASASEILAGALHDHGVAKLVGEKSYGKGSVQELVNLPHGAQLKVTVAHWFTPNGVNISKEGIAPDTEVKMQQADVDAGRDPQLDKALQLLQ